MIGAFIGNKCIAQQSIEDLLKIDFSKKNNMNNSLDYAQIRINIPNFGNFALDQNLLESNVSIARLKNFSLPLDIPEIKEEALLNNINLKKGLIRVDSTDLKINKEENINKISVQKNHNQNMYGNFSNLNLDKIGENFVNKFTHSAHVEDDNKNEQSYEERSKLFMKATKTDQLAAKFYLEATNSLDEALTLFWDGNPSLK